MAEIRQLLAYLGWESSGSILFDPHTEDHYLYAWEDFSKRLRSSANKVISDEFGEAKRYLEEKYVTLTDDGYRIDYKKIDKAGEYNIIKIKSDRILKVTGQRDHGRYWDHERNWYDAEIYVRMYYENIIPAVMTADEKSINAVIRAFDYSMKGGMESAYKGAYRIINAFEMALAIYFLSTTALENVSLPGD